LAAALIVACWGLLSAVALGADDVFEGLAPELVHSELASVLEGAELACRQDRADPKIRRCTPLPGVLGTLGGVGVNAVEARFDDQRLALVTVYLVESRFAAILPVLAVRLGEGKNWNVVLRAGMAGQFEGQIRIWETDRFVLIAQQFDGRIDRSSVIYGSPRAMAPLLQQIKSTPRGGLRDL
jgi:hypothetical protein